MRLAEWVGRNPWRALFIATPFATAFYGLATRAPFRTPLAIHPTAFDAWLPLSPWTAWPYLSYYVLPLALIVLARRLGGFGRVLLAAFGSTAACIVINNVMPTRLVAPPAAPPGSLLALLQWADTPLGAMPSGHVALPVAIAAGCALAARGGDGRAWRRLAAVYAAWSIILAAAALLTKQHYLPDVIAGVVVGIVVAASIVPHARTVHAATARAFALEWIAIAATIVAALHWWSVPVAAIAMIVLGTRQHGLFILFHDGVHGLIASPRRLNDGITNVAAGVPLLVPVHLYRAVHIGHHRHLGTERDPERVLLYHAQPWRYRPLALGPLARQVAGDVLGWHNIVMAVRFFRVRRDPRSPLRMAATRAYPELALTIALFAAAVIAGAIVAPVITGRIALLWLVPYFTLTQLLQKVRSFAEHAGEGSADAITYSWAPGLLGRLTIWPYNINYHREHHARPGVPWNEIPSAIPSTRRRPGRELVSHLWSGALR
ncbi:MAG: fatty acid desaturase [Gemmatimonadaceae bacterium]